MSEVVYDQSTVRTDRKTFISPHTVDSLAVSLISMKYLQSWICTTAARYQQI